MQIVSDGEDLHGMLNTVFSERGWWWGGGGGGGGGIVALNHLHVHVCSYKSKLAILPLAQPRPSGILKSVQKKPISWSQTTDSHSQQAPIF